ncbi:MAG: plasmid mobilization protein [Eubacterium sp.]
MSQKNRDDKNRWRSVTIAFRMSPEESEELNNRVKLCGFRTKQDYLIQSVLHQKVAAKGNPLMMVQFRKNLRQIERELERIGNISEMDEELLTPIRTMLEIMEGFEKGQNE